MASVGLPSMLRGLAGGASHVEVAAGTLGAALDVLGERYPALERRLRDERGALRRYVNFYVDGEECRRLAGPATPLQPHTEVVIIPSVAGG
ncbi:molybdopterin synthase sulfur carrier subunit [Prauserella sp. PE36]|uniref:MoaD/ThiS family protein n=1 Tax=Prauserella endophytica TaxID=1592324 RepID=A0ABY2S4U5_9PSEU|nr:MULTISPECIES: MoaD/ThiS family protein [Prauserella]PXY34226.1 molybdopterin synthase sulfur carrier subunit [Prauserella coralliicola]RBM18001.1 molybdopterin synthase sulfur carrier subunit [Prauserella sp. PE36]TKG70082.1 MoaD/ThiS family protein [Prauserella endophytica]